jgi:hypothetical protein
MTATWQPNPYSPDEVEGLVDDDGSVIALVEDFGYACYPSAINASTGNRERGGAYYDRVEARLWCERVAGLHPAKPGDGRPPFYYKR